MVETASVNTTVFAVSFALYTLAIITVGVYSARFAKRSDEDFFLAGRSLGPWVAALSASASSESGWVTLGLVGWAFANGFAAYWIIPGCLVGFMFNWFVIAPRMRDRSGELGALTIPDFFALSFNERLPLLRSLSVVVILVAMMLYVAAQLAAAGKAFSASFGGIDYTIGVLFGAIIVLIYTVLGGFRAACWTDFAQAFLMVGTLVVFPVYLLSRHGGFGFINAELTAVDQSLVQFLPDKAGIAFLGFLLGSGALGINFGYSGQPHVLVRFMALRDRKDAIIAGVVSSLWAVLVYWGAVTVGLMARSFASTGAEWGRMMLEDPTKNELGLVLSAMHMLPEVLAGLVLAAVLAAICSTADSQLVVAASSVANDLFARIFAKSKDKSHMIVNRLVVLSIGVAAVLLVIFDPKEVYKFVLSYGWAILGASFGPQLILLLFWRRASYAGCLLGMATGFVVALVWQLKFESRIGDIEVYNLPLAFCAALLVNVIASLALPSKAPSHSGSQYNSR